MSTTAEQGAAPAAGAHGDGVLSAEDVRMHFAAVRAVDGVTLELRCDEIVGLIGPNGAGKTTLLHVLSGFLRPTAGRISVDGADVTRVAAHRRVRLGVVRTFQDVRPFRQFTVLENVMIAALGARGSRADARAQALELLALVNLDHAADRLAAAVPHGDERRLGMARAMALEPRFLLLDEPAAGLDEQESEELGVAIRRVREQTGCGVLLVEHDMRLVASVCERLHVLDYGCTIAAGATAEALADEAVVRAYLGSAHGAA